jgi:hypothetical protein
LLYYNKNRSLEVSLGSDYILVANFPERVFYIN